MPCGSKKALASLEGNLREKATRGGLKETELKEDSVAPWLCLSEAKAEAEEFTEAVMTLTG